MRCFDIEPDKRRREDIDVGVSIIGYDALSGNFVSVNTTVWLK